MFFCVSGTTGIAYIKHGRGFIENESESEYVKLALDRWAKVHSQPSLYQTKKYMIPKIYATIPQHRICLSKIPDVINSIFDNDI
jgi:DNA modification methylase